MKPIRLILLDLDGTLYVDQTVIAGAVEAVSELRRLGYTLRFLTNTTTKSQADLYRQLHDMGFELTPDELISAPAAARLELIAMQRQLGRALRVWPVVAEAISGDFDGFEHDEEHPDYIVLGDIGEVWDLALINRLFQAIRRGATLIALHKNRFWQTIGDLKVDIGFFVAGLEYVTGQPSMVMGKPSEAFFDRVLNDAGISAAEAVVIGDDIDSDIGGAQAQGMRGVLVQTGKYRESYVAQSSIRPDAILGSVAELVSYLQSR
jgi:HAD superfamily hydrolase (TIGR01458 family)